MQLSLAKSQGVIYLHGQARLQVEQGEVSILGRNLDSSSGSFDIFSPKCNALLSLEAVSETAVVGFTSLSENGLSAVDSLQPYFANLFVPDLSAGNLEEIVPGCFIVKDFGNFETFHPLIVSDTWKAAAASLSTPPAVPVVLVCGQRKVGKSTFSRFITNSLLNGYDSVEFVDLDPGQTEFTTAGFLVRKEIQRPGLFGPPFTHLCLPDDSIFLACSSPVEMPVLYCQAILELSKRLQVSLAERSRPVVINTMGWMTGLGFEFLQFAAKCFRPNFIFCFSEPEAAEDGADSILAALSGPSGIRHVEIEAFTEGELASLRLNYLSSSIGELPKPKFHPSNWRDLAYWCYFFSRVDSQASLKDFSFSSLSQLKPMVVPLGKLQLATSNREQDLFELLGQGRLKRLKSMLLTGLVGLVFDEKYCGTRSLNLLPKHEHHRIASMKAFGVGIIRSIHSVKRGDGVVEYLLHIITPLPLPIVKQCNTLLLGSLSLPSSLHLSDQLSIQAEAPFISTQNHSETVGAGVRTNRPNVLRRRE